jgi:hypothetical protein
VKVLLIFIDGFGLGLSDAAVNPLARYPIAFFQRLYGCPLTKDLPKILNKQGCMIPTDASLGVDGLPQSATGQTAIFTGVNAPKWLGRHVQAFPGPQLQKILYSHGIMKQLSDKGYTVTSANMYTPDYQALVAQRKRRHSATTLTILGAGSSLRSVDEMLQGKAVYQDITNAMLPQMGVTGVPVIEPRIAAQRLVGLGKSHDFVMFEYFQTDRCGHKQDWEWASKIVGILDEFLQTIYTEITSEMLVIITSDHGNFEDLSIKTHTLNRVPTILFGSNCVAAAEKINSLTDIAPTVISFIERNDVCD